MLGEWREELAQGRRAGGLIVFLASFLLGYLFLPGAFPEAERGNNAAPLPSLSHWEPVNFMGESTQKRILMRQEEEFPGASVGPVTEASQESCGGSRTPSGLGTRSLRPGANLEEARGLGP